MISVTRRQRQCLDFIARYEATRGIAPSFEEMRAALGLGSKSQVHRLVTALEARGRLRRLPGRARALEVVRPAAGAWLLGEGPALSAALAAAVRARLARRHPARRVFPRAAIDNHLESRTCGLTVHRND
jgi:repressor LexA